MIKFSKTEKKKESLLTEKKMENKKLGKIIRFWLNK